MKIGEEPIFGQLHVKTCLAQAMIGSGIGFIIYWDYKFEVLCWSNNRDMEMLAPIHVKSFLVDNKLNGCVIIRFC